MMHSVNHRNSFAPAFFLFLIGLLAGRTAAELPSQDQIDKDLAGPFAAVSPKPDLSHAGPLCEEIKPVILQQAEALILRLHSWKDDPAALLMDAGDSKDGIRQNAETAYGLAVIARFIDARLDADQGGLSPAIAKEKAIAILRFVLPTYGAGGKLCTDGKPWQKQWQSAHWANSAAQTAWLLWDDLDPQTKWLAANMLEEEADRFIDRPPDHQVIDDTKAEENAWNAQAPALAFNMFPHHPHHAAWGEAAIRWQISSFMTSADTKRTDVIDGKPLNQWFAFPNIYDDYSLENHNRVHPDYMCAMTLNIYQMLSYDLAGNPTPQAVLFNLDKVYASLKKLALPDCGWAYPNGQDWQIHRNPDWMNVNLPMAVLFNDPQAAEIGRTCIATTLKMIARSPKLGAYQPGETGFSASQTTVLDGSANSYLLMGLHGEGPAPVAEDQLWKDLAGVHQFEFGKFVVARTDHSVSTFSWGRQVMGMVLPLRKDLLCTPNDHGMVGYVNVDGVKNEAPVVQKIQLSNLPGGFAIAGILTRGEGAVEQRIAFAVLPDGRTVYVDSAKIIGKTPQSVELGTIGILNDKNWVYHDGKRTLASAGGSTEFDAANAATDKSLLISSPWYNIDGLGILVLSSSGQQMYIPKSNTPRIRAGRLEQLFHLNHPSSPDQLKPTVLVFYPTQTTPQTGAMAGKVKLESSDARHFVITLEDGNRLSADLDGLSVTTQ